jgi:zinc protease
MLHFRKSRLPHLIALAFAFWLSACGKPDAGTAEVQGIFPYPIHVKDMKNGLRVVTVPYDSPGLASFFIIVRVGSRHEVEEGKTGFAHFFEHMMFRGTDKYPKDLYSQELQLIGAGANANTWLDRTVYHMTGNAGMLEKMFELEADRFMYLNYPVPDFKVEAGAVKGEYTKNFASQYRQIGEAIQDTAFDYHTYKHTTMGFFDDIVDMPNQYEYSLEFYKKFYRPEYTTILVVGDVAARQVEALANKYFGKWERGNHVAEIPVEPEQTETRYVHIQNPGFIPMLSMNFKTPAYNDTSRDVAALSIISDLLFSDRSDLYKDLVVERQIALNVSGSYFLTVDPYLYTMSATTRNEENLQDIKVAIDAAIQKLQTEPVDSLLLAQTKSRSKYQLLMSLDDPDNIANTLSYFIWVTGDPWSLNRYYNTYLDLTPEDIQQAAQRYFTPERLTLATISSQPKGGLQ